MRTSSTPYNGASLAITASTNSSGAEAPAVTPTVPLKSEGNSWAEFTRKTLAHPASRARRSRARVFDELADPMTMMASHRGAIDINADCRFVVAKQRSLRPGVQTWGKRS